MFAPLWGLCPSVRQYGAGGFGALGTFFSLGLDQTRFGLLVPHLCFAFPVTPSSGFQASPQPGSRLGKLFDRLRVRFSNQHAELGGRGNEESRSFPNLDFGNTLGIVVWSDALIDKGQARRSPV